MKMDLLKSVVVLGLVIAGSAQADIPPAQAGATAPSEAPAVAAGTSVNEFSAPKKASVLDSFSLSLFSNYHGQPVGDLSVEKNPGKKGYSAKSLGVYFDSSITAGYKITPDLKIGPELSFFYTPVRGVGYETQYLGLKLYNSHIKISDEIVASANIMPQLPFSDYLKQVQQVSWGLKTTPSAFYKPRGTSFTLGAYTEAKSYFGVPIGQKSFKLWALPTATYDFNDTFGVSLSYEMEASHIAGKQNKLEFNNVLTDLQPGLRWRITKKIQFNPYVTLYTGDGVTGSNTAVGAIINASVL